jgi:hypothetical protein
MAAVVEVPMLPRSRGNFQKQQYKKNMSNETFLTYERTSLNQDQTGRRAPSKTR